MTLDPLSHALKSCLFFLLLALSFFFARDFLTILAMALNWPEQLLHSNFITSVYILLSWIIVMDSGTVFIRTNPVRVKLDLDFGVC